MNEIPPSRWGRIKPPSRCQLNLTQPVDLPDTQTEMLV